MSKRKRDSNSQSWKKSTVSVLSLAISVIALINSCQSTKISKQIQEPIFVQTSTLPAIEAGGDPYEPLDTVGVRFFNYGGVPCHIKSITVQRVWSFSNAIAPENNYSFIVSDFYSLTPNMHVRGYQGLVTQGFNIGNNKFESQFWDGFYKLASKHFIRFKTSTLSKIEYDNLMHEVRVLHFKDGEPIESVEYEGYFKNVPDDLRYGVVMSEINVTNIVNRLVSGLRSEGCNKTKEGSNVVPEIGGES